LTWNGGNIYIGWRNGELERVGDQIFKKQIKSERKLMEWLGGRDYWRGEDVGDLRSRI
jgi:hypothetical protein